MAALNALNWKKVALMALNRKNNGVNGVEAEKKAAITALKRKSSGVNGVKPEK